VSGDRPLDLELLTFVKVVQRLGLSAQEIADAVWLSANTTGLARPQPAGPESSWPGETSSAFDVAGAIAPRHRFPVYVPQAERASPLVREHPGLGSPADVPIRVPSPAGSHAAALGRSLRSLRGRPSPGPADAGFDEAATAERVAASDICWPVPRLRRSRRDEAVVVVDPSTSMELWSDLESELVAGIRLSGAFRRWSSWTITEHQGKATATPRTGPLAEPQPFGRLCDPTGRSVALVLTDGIARLWHDGAGFTALEALARCGPVAVVEPLPHRLWRRTGLEPRRTLIASSQCGPTATRLQVVGAANATALPVPILEAHPEWITDWARLVSGQTPFARRAVVGRYFGRNAVGAEPPVVEPSPTAPVRETSSTAVPARQLVRRFQAAASPVATELATALSLVPLTVPIMQAVRTLCFSGSSPVHLAEVISSGLLNRDPDELRRSAMPVFQWLPGVREELRRAVTADRARSVREALSTYLDTDLGITSGSGEFPAIIALSERSVRSTAGAGDPFAWVLPETARRAVGWSSSSGTFPDIGDSSEAARLVEQGKQLALRALETGRSADIEEGIEATRRAVSGSRLGDPQHSMAVTDLARLLLSRWNREGSLDDLDEAVAVLRVQVEVGPPSAPGGNSEDLALLAELLRLRYEASSSPDYLDEAIHVRRSLIATLPSGASDLVRHRVLLAQLLYLHHRATGSTLSLYEALDALDGVGPLESVEPDVRIIADITSADCLDVVSRSTRTDDDMDAADRQWLRMVGELAAVPSDSTEGVRHRIEARVEFLRLSGLFARATALADRFQAALSELPEGWGSPSNPESDREAGADA